MITRLKRRFIVLAMTSLIILLSVIVAGMNIINYESVVRNADDTLEMLSDNKGRMPILYFDDFDDFLEYDDDYPDHDDDDFSDYDDIDARTDDPYSPEGGEERWYLRSALPKMSRDEAEGTRFFSVLVGSDGKAAIIQTDRIFAVSQDEAAEYAEEIVASGREKGFIEDYRYRVSEEGAFRRVTFLDCGRTLESFREFLKDSILMSVIGLIAVFFIICYFAGRIVRPVAESYEKQKRFITDAGHEIKTPLAVIKANIDVMKMDLEDLPDDEGDTAESLSDSLADIDGQVDRLTALTNDLVYLSRMEEAGNQLTMAEIPVSDIVSETADPFRALASERGRSISSDITPMLSINGSSKEIEKLVSILMENAVKYSPEGEDINIKLAREGKNVVLEVRNKAAEPLSDEDLAHVFDRFYRADKSRNSAAGGHGIGLSVANAIVSAHGGKIRADSGDGTEFIVTASFPAI